MQYLIFLVLGPALIFLGTKGKSRHSSLSGTVAGWTFILLSVQVPGLLFELLKTKYGKLGLGGAPFALFDPSTWNGLHYFLVIGLVIYGLGLIILSLAHEWPAYPLILAGAAMLEYDVLALIVGGIMGSDFFLLALLGIGLKLVIELWTGVMAYCSTFGLLLPAFGRSGGSSSPSPFQGGGDGEGETGLGHMPARIHSAGGTTYYLRQNFGWGAEYVASDDPGDTITISNVYSRTGSEMSTNAGHFYL